jgi:hypothetical protein
VWAEFEFAWAAPFATSVWLQGVNICSFRPVELAASSTCSYLCRSGVSRCLALGNPTPLILAGRSCRRRNRLGCVARSVPVAWGMWVAGRLVERLGTVARGIRGLQKKLLRRAAQGEHGEEEEDVQATEQVRKDVRCCDKRSVGAFPRQSWAERVAIDVTWTMSLFTPLPCEIKKQTNVGEQMKGKTNTQAKWAVASSQRPWRSETEQCAMVDNRSAIDPVVLGQGCEN